LTTVLASNRDNWSNAHNSFTHKGPDNVPLAILYGFSSAMLGITGFEARKCSRLEGHVLFKRLRSASQTTANFVEQQKPGTFAKTLRNMICLVRVSLPA
jgi:hypothetical protein